MVTLIGNVHAKDDVRCIFLGASHCMPFFLKVVREMQNLKVLGYVKVQHYGTCPIAHIGSTPLNTHDGKR